MKRPSDPDALFLETLVEGAAGLGIDLCGEGIDKIQAHRQVLMKWARKMNLTTVRDPEGMAELLYLDSMMLLPQLGPGCFLHDIGTGAGFPGLVVKACRTEARVVLTEARQKKVSFLRQAAREMQLSEGLEILCRRLGHDSIEAGGWSDVVSRAAIPPAEWIRMGGPLVDRGGRLWIFLGQPEELTSLDKDPQFEIADKISYHLPRTAKDRLLVSLRRID